MTATTRRPFVALPLAALLATALGLAACGSGGTTAAQPEGSIRVVLTEFKFDPASISTHSGRVVLFLVNSGGSGHDLTVVDASGRQVAHSDLVQAGNTAVLTISDLPAGTYRIICTQPGHEAAGMKGTLTAT